MIFSLSMLPPETFSAIYHDGDSLDFLFVFFFTFLSGFILWYGFRYSSTELKTRDGFFIVTLFWVVLSIYGALPFIIALYPNCSFTDAVFETMSGLTTTGSTVFSHLSHLSHAVLYYRQQLHLLGGIGIIVLAVAILPMLGVGGMQLYRAEIAGPVKTSKLTPRITQTAKALWGIYIGLVVLCAFSYWGAGMTWFDAIGESYATIATGGFSMHDQSFAFYHSALIDLIGVFFMLLGATNFSLHFHFLRNKRLSLYWRDIEFRNYIFILFGATLIIAITLLVYNVDSFGGDWVNALFTVVSLSSTTGFETTHFATWPTYLPYLLMFVALLGGCAGSTSGGLKIIRLLMLREQSIRELKKLIHPRAVFAIKLGEEKLSDNIAQAIWSFAAMYVALFIVLWLLLLASGLDLETAFGALAACISNTGASIGNVAVNFEHINAFSKWVLTFSMLAGRLEIFTLFVLFMPAYWRR